MTQKWRPERDWSDPDGGRKWLDKLLGEIEFSGGVRVHHVLWRWDVPERRCRNILGEFGACGKTARYLVLTSVVNTFKGSKRENRVYVCSLRHITRRVRDYFGIDGAAMDIDDREARNGKV